MENHLVPSTSLALPFTCSPRAVFDWDFVPVAEDLAPRLICEHLERVLLAGLGGGSEVLFASGVVCCDGFAELAAGRLRPAPEVVTRPPGPRLALTYPELQFLGRYGWTVDLPGRPRELVITNGRVLLELDDAELQAFARGIAFHVLHAENGEERQHWRRFVDGLER